MTELRWFRRKLTRAERFDDARKRRVREAMAETHAAPVLQVYELGSYGSRYWCDVPTVLGAGEVDGG